MDQPTQPRGDFVAFLNRDKQPGDRRPIFEGRIAKPGSDHKHDLTLWAHEFTDKATGEIKTMYTGTVGAVSTDMDPADQIAALTRTANTSEQTFGNLSLRPRQVAIFPNGYKDEAPDKDRPDLWGAINFGDGTPVVRASVWFKKTRSGEVMLSGATSYPIPGKSEAEMQAAEPDLATMMETGQVTKGMPKKSKSGRSD
ncbi:MAG: hypothetical protein APF80_12000 [Alphaproteobacteria bacterium BRH_c36]|nr:MAG: hypothetical protein APF80_12000 [Alphaproteobacteria bacterium BRH_c36]